MQGNGISRLCIIGERGSRYKPHFFLPETHTSLVRAEEVSTALGFDTVVRVDANGFAGGIQASWNSQTIHVCVHHIHSRCLTLVSGGSFWVTMVLLCESYFCFQG